MEAYASADVAVGRARREGRTRAKRSAAVLLWRRVSAGLRERRTSGDFLPKLWGGDAASSVSVCELRIAIC